MPAKKRKKVSKKACGFEVANIAESSPEKIKKSSKTSSKSIGIGGNSHKKIIIKQGTRPVDSECVSKINSAHVYFSSDENIYDAMLNQTNIAQNNNKYYILQILKDDSSKNYSVWFRWGRVGFRGQSNLISCGNDLNKAVKLFEDKFFNKTKNHWGERDNFIQVAGKYDLIQVDHETDVKTEKTTETIDAEHESNLDKRIQALLNMICDVKKMQEGVVEMKYNADKAPLGRLSNDQIQLGYKVLNDIAKELKKNKSAEKPVVTKSLKNLSSQFYTRIPHYFGMRIPPVICTLETIKEKIKLLEALSNIEIAVNILKNTTTEKGSVIDQQYEALQCTLVPLHRSTETFALISDYLKYTHGPTHCHYGMELMNVFECSKTSNNLLRTNLNNHVLLWHGSRMLNWFGILSQGLRIAPPEAPKTGYMFGKGIYFADVSSKSANYCYPSRKNAIGLLLLCEVALGCELKLYDAKYDAHDLPIEFHSVKGVGKYTPDPKMFDYIDDGKVLVPKGRLTLNSTDEGKSSLQYNEYVVYDVSQVRFRYLCQVKFEFDRADFDNK